MCGIIADFHPSGQVSEAELGAALHAMRRRGPDGAGVWLSPDRRVGLGHARLAVIDPEGSPQPIASEDGSVVVAVVALTLMLVIGFGTYSVVGTQTRLSGEERVRESAFNLAEGALGEVSAEC